MNTKHTPGPWTIGQDYGGNYAVCSSRAKVANHVATVPVFNGMSHSGASVPHEQSVAEANARLIAAAPELLEALQFAFAKIVFDNPKLDAARNDRALNDIVVGIENKIRAAIAKATGEGA